MLSEEDGFIVIGVDVFVVLEEVLFVEVVEVIGME